jgi:hypothetical protein
MVRGYKPDVNVALVVNARIWTNNTEKDRFARLLFRIGKYDSKYWKIPNEANT